jgi:hypothetical protein
MGEIRIANGAAARWRENIERKKESEEEERERGGEIFRELSHVK